jgi:hypothetical protein
MKIQFAKNPSSSCAFTLLEVMFAVIAFFTASFAILALVSTSLGSARLLQQPMVDGGEVAGQLSQTNSLVEGEESGDLSELLGKQYQDYSWKYDIQEAQTNKLFQVDFIVQRNSGNNPVVSKMSILLFRPASPAGSLDGATAK